MARFALLLEKFGLETSNLPLSIYRNQSFYSMKTDALDRFGTKLEKRFTKNEIKSLMSSCGLEKIKFSNSEPFWMQLVIKNNFNYIFKVFVNYNRPIKVFKINLYHIILEYIIVCYSFNNNNI